MLDLKSFLTEQGYSLQKQFKISDDRCICLVRRPDGSSAVWRLYDRPVFAYQKLISTKCPQLPEVYNFSEIDCGGCLVEEEFIDGIPLANLIEIHCFDEYQTASIAHHVCNALAVLHHKNMVHRDIKPENILITSAGRVVLIDLDAVSPRTSSKDRDTQLLGTVGYAAPEQYGFGHSDGRTDIFGMGVLMNVLLTGKHPVQELTGGPLRPIIEKCIAVNADQRYATVEELIAQLPDHTAQRCSSCGFVSPGGGCVFCGIPAKPVRTPRRRLRKGIAAACSLILLGLCFGLLRNALFPGPAASVDPTPPAPQSVPSPDTEPDPIPTPDEPAEHTEPPAVSDPAASQEPADEPSPPPPVSPEIPADSPPPVSEPAAEGSSAPEAPAESAAVPEPPVESSPAPEPSLPVFDDELSYKATAFLYDLDGDGMEEEYYFGLMATQNVYLTKLVITTPTEDGLSEKRTIAPVVWKRTANGDLVLVPQFSALLEEPEIIWYLYKSDTPPVVQEAEPLNGWAGAAEISCGFQDSGHWIAEGRARLGELELSACAQVLTRDPSKAPITPSQELGLTDGTPTELPHDAEFSSKSQLLFGEYTVYGCTAQNLDNGFIRFCVDFEGPAGLTATAFDPPDGALFLCSSQSQTSGAREVLVFDLPVEQMRAVNKFTITFSSKTEGRFLVFISTTGL